MPILFKLSALKTFISSYKYVFVVFPALFLFLFASELSFISQNSLVLHKLCVSIYNQTLCESDVFRNKSLENEVESLSNSWNLWLNISFAIPSIISIFFLVSDADRKSSYKLFMLVSLSGFILYSSMCAIAATQEPNVCMYLLMTAQILNGIFGGGSLAFITSCLGFVSINDDKVNATNTRTDSKYSNRSVKYSILESSILFGRLVASIISGYILSNRANFMLYRDSFLISLSIFAMLFIYMIIMFCSFKVTTVSSVVSVLNRNFNSSTDRLDISISGETDENISVIAERKPKKKTNLIEKLFCVKDTWNVLMKRRERNIRFYFLMFLFIYFLTSVVTFGAGTIDYLFLTKIPISFNQTHYGLFRAMNTLLKGIALLIILPILKNYFDVSDSVLFIIGLVSDIFNYIVFSFASSIINIIWIAPFAFMFANYYIVCLRSFISKLIDKNDIGIRISI